MSNGIDTTTDPVLISPNTWTVTPKPVAVAHQDTGASFQLQKVFGSAMTLGDTIVCRDGTYNNGATATGGGRWFLTAPAKIPNANGYAYPWAGTYSKTSPRGRITITSEHPYSGVNARGNPNVGGGCQLAYVIPNPHGTDDVELPVDWLNVNFENDVAGPAYVYSLTNLYPGMRLINSTARLGPGVTNSALINLVTYTYGGALPAGTAGTGAAAVDTSVNGSDVTISGNDFSNGKSVQVYAGAHAYPHAIITNNVVHDMQENGFSLSSHGAAYVADNLLYNVHGSAGIHGDYIIFNTQSYDGTVQPGPTLLRNIVLHGKQPTTIDGLGGPFGGTSGTITAGSCSALSNITYYQTPLSTVTGGGQQAYADVTVSGAPNACAITAVRSPAAAPAPQYNVPSGQNLTYFYTIFTAGQTQPGGQGYAVGDRVSAHLGGAAPYPIADTGVTVFFSVSAVTNNPDGIAIFQANGSDSSTGTLMQNNILENEIGDTIVATAGSASGAGNTTIEFNDAANDWQASDHTYGAQTGVIVPQGANVNASYNVTNAYSMASTSGAVNCLPGAPNDTPACQGAENTTRIPTTGYNLTAYQAVWKAYNTQSTYLTGCADVGHCYNRANAILNHEPTPGGRGQVSGTLYATALCPRDNAGVLYWNTGICDATATHPPAQ